MEVEEPSPPSFSFLQMLMSKGTTWLRSSRPRQLSDPSTSQDLSGNDLEEEEEPLIQQCISRRAVPPSPVASRPVEQAAPPPTGSEKPLHREAQRHQGLLGADPLQPHPPGCDIRHPSLRIYPRMPTRVPDRLGPIQPFFSSVTSSMDNHMCYIKSCGGAG